MKAPLPSSRSLVHDAGPDRAGARGRSTRPTRGLDPIGDHHALASSRRSDAERGPIVRASAAMRGLRAPRFGRRRARGPVRPGRRGSRRSRLGARELWIPTGPWIRCWRRSPTNSRWSEPPLRTRSGPSARRGRCGRRVAHRPQPARRCAHRARAPSARRSCRRGPRARRQRWCGRRSRAIDSARRSTSGQTNGSRCCRDSLLSRSEQPGDPRPARRGRAGRRERDVGGPGEPVGHRCRAAGERARGDRERRRARRWCEPLLSMWDGSPPTIDPGMLIERLRNDPDDWIRACTELAFASRRQTDPTDRRSHDDANPGHALPDGAGAVPARGAAVLGAATSGPATDRRDRRRACVRATARRSPSRARPATRCTSS